MQLLGLEVKWKRVSFLSHNKFGDRFFQQAMSPVQYRTHSLLISNYLSNFWAAVHHDQSFFYYILQFY